MAGFGKKPPTRVCEKNEEKNNINPRDMLFTESSDRKHREYRENS